MKTVLAAAVQISGRLLDVEANTELACAALHAAADSGAELAVLPELLNTGFADTHEALFMSEFYEKAEVLGGRFTGALTSVARSRRLVVVAGFAERDTRVPGLIYNSAVVLGPDGPVDVYRKTHVPRMEKHYFRPGDRFPVWDTPHGRLGVLLCADNSFPEVPRILALAGAEVLAVPYAAQRMPNPDLYRWITATRAYENQLYVISANRCGSMADLVFAGTSTIAGPDGSVLATLGEQEKAATAELSGEALVRARLRQTRYRDRRPELYPPLSEKAPL